MYETTRALSGWTGNHKKPVKVDDEEITLTSFIYCSDCGIHYLRSDCPEHGGQSVEKPKCLEKK